MSTSTAATDDRPSLPGAAGRSLAPPSPQTPTPQTPGQQSGRTQEPRRAPALPIALSVVGVLLMFLIAAAAPNDHTLDLAMPLLRLPALAGPVSTYLTCAAIAAQGAGLIGMLRAAERGWRPRPRRLLAVGGLGACLLTLATPVGSADMASYAAYGRIASLGLDPYHAVPADLGGDYAGLVSNMWVRTPSVYGPVATFVQRIAADIGGDRVLLTIAVLMAANTLVYLATGLILDRAAADRGRAALLWAANPLLLGLLVGGGHLDTYIALFAVCAAVLAARRPDRQGEAVIGALLGLACGVKISAALLVVGLSWPLLRERSWDRLLIRGVSCLGVVALLYAPIGLHALAPLSGASQLVSLPSVWQLVQLAGRLLIGPAVAAALISAGWPVLMLVLGRLFLRRGPGPGATDRDSLEQPRTAHALALGWNIAAPWSMPWYTAMTWPLAALLPRARTDYVLAGLTLILALFHNTGGHGWSW